MENLYTPDALEKSSVIFIANLKDITRTIKISENLFLPIVSVHNHLLVKQQEINDERGL